MAGHSEMMRRQQALAAFGDFVLDHEDLDEILNEGCRLIALALGADLAKVIEIERVADTGLVRAGIGWRPGIVGHERVSLSEQSSEAFAIETTQPVITNDLAHETRFAFPAFLREHGVVALVNVPILLPGRRPWGILQVDAREVRAFDQEDVEFLKTYAMALGPVIDRLRVADEREEARRGMAEREGQLRTVLEGMEQRYYVLDNEWRFLFASRSALEAWGKSPEEVLGRRLLDCFPEAAGSVSYEAQRRVMEGGPPEHFKTLSPVLNRWIEIGVSPAGPEGLSVVLRDIDDQERAEAALRESEERLRSAMEVGRLGLWDWNVQTGEVHWSDEHFRMQGYAVGEIPPSYLAWAARIHPDDRLMTEAALNRAMERREEYVSEFACCIPMGPCAGSMAAAASSMTARARRSA